MDPLHPDYAELSAITDEVTSLFGGASSLEERFPKMIAEALDYVIDPVRTGRTLIEELDRVEKTYIGLKVEHFLRDVLNVPAGLRDLVVGGRDVDVKNTIGRTWMIPPESVAGEDPCLLTMTAEADGHCSFGAMMARPQYLSAPNRDGKRAVSKAGTESIFWMLQRCPLPKSRFAGLDMARFRQLRDMHGGTRRAAQFFEENLDRVTHRDVVRALLHDQLDYMKRLRGNGGARDILEKRGIALLSGKYDTERLQKLGNFECDKDEFIALKV